MTEEQIKALLNGIINNGEKWECRPTARCAKCYPSCALCDWRPYKLGDEIHADWEYRKVETWFVYGHVNNFKLTSEFDTTLNIWHKGTKEECEKWIEEHTKKSWLEESMELQGCISFPRCSDYEKKKICFKKGATEVCKKILKEVKKTNNILGSIVYKDVEDIIKDLGIEL